jgi:hypothetical protein
VVAIGRLAQYGKHHQETVERTMNVNKVWVITPFLGQRETLIKRFVETLARSQDVKVLGCGRNGITVSVPADYTGPKIRETLPKEDADSCFVEVAEAPVLMGNLRPKIRG